MRVLVVEDDALLADVVTRGLRREGMADCLATVLCDRQHIDA